jgi:hypothetical protein
MGSMERFRIVGMLVVAMVLGVVLNGYCAANTTGIQREMSCTMDGGKEERFVRSGSTQELLDVISNLALYNDFECVIRDKSSITRLSFAHKIDDTAKGYRTDCDLPFSDTNISKTHNNEIAMTTDFLLGIKIFIESQQAGKNFCKFEGNEVRGHIQLSKSLLTEK